MAFLLYFQERSPAEITKTALLTCKALFTPLSSVRAPTAKRSVSQGEKWGSLS